MFSTFKRLWLSAACLLLCSVALCAYSGGDGTEANPYQISTVADWEELASYNNRPNLDKYYILTTDLDLEGISLSTVGGSVKAFTGSFDGNNHVIRNVTFDRPNGDYVGLFGRASENSHIYNLGVENVDVSGRNSVGGLCGSTNGTISQCYVTGSITGDTFVGGLAGSCHDCIITCCYVNVEVTGTSSTGGLCGAVFSTYNGDLYGLSPSMIKNCYYEGVVTGTRETGGIVGHNMGELISSYATGSITGDYSVGGLCGTNSATINQCYATGSVTGNNAVGGLCGVNHNTINQCYAAGSVAGNSSVGGLCGKIGWGIISDCYWNMETSGQPTSNGGWGLTSTQMREAANFYGWLDGNWTIQEGIDLPHLAWENTGGTVIMTDYPARTYLGSGTETEPFQIATSSDLVNLSRQTADWDKYFILINDIDLGGRVFRHAIIAGAGGLFSGVFDGNSYVLSNFSINQPNNDFLGVFGRIGYGGQVSSLGLESFSITGCSNVGGLCGGIEEGGTISQCYANGAISGNSDCVGGLCGNNEYGTITGCFSAGSVSGYSFVGGLCGYSDDDEIIQSYSKSAVTGNDFIGGLCGYSNDSDISQTYATGEVMGNDYVGGLCGNNYYCTISQSYSTGNVIGYNDIGGLCGHTDEDTVVTASFFDMDTSGQIDSDGGFGRTTDQMKEQSTFTNAGWDFSSTWYMPVNDYPKLISNAPDVLPDIQPETLDITKCKVKANTKKPDKGKFGIKADMLELSSDDLVNADTIRVSLYNGNETTPFYNEEFSRGLGKYNSRGQVYKYKNSCKVGLNLKKGILILSANKVNLSGYTGGSVRLEIAIGDTYLGVGSY